MWQSAYRAHHSTETALLKVQTDILKALDHGSTCVLVLLDLSATFDMLDHTILIKRLNSIFGITGTALKWFKSCVSDRYQTVTINGEAAEALRLQYGVLQESVLGPLLYSIYRQPLVTSCSIGVCTIISMLMTLSCTTCSVQESETQEQRQSTSHSQQREKELWPMAADHSKRQPLTYGISSQLSYGTFLVLTLLDVHLKLTSLSWSMIDNHNIVTLEDYNI